MKEIKAYIRKTMVDNVRDALEKIPGIPGVAYNEVGGFGHVSTDRHFTNIKMVKLEIDLPDDMVEMVVQCIVENARTGKGHHGDGRVYVSKLEDGINIRDGSSGEKILKYPAS